MPTPAELGLTIVPQAMHTSVLALHNQGRDFALQGPNTFRDPDGAPISASMTMRTHWGVITHGYQRTHSRRGDTTRVETFVRGSLGYRGEQGIIQVEPDGTIWSYPPVPDKSSSLLGYFTDHAAAVKEQIDAGEQPLPHRRRLQEY